MPLAKKHFGGFGMDYFNNLNMTSMVLIALGCLCLRSGTIIALGCTDVALTISESLAFTFDTANNELTKIFVRCCEAILLLIAILLTL